MAWRRTRKTIVTRIVVEAGRRFAVRLDELHNDSTSIRFTGQYRQARGRTIRGKQAPWITYGYSMGPATGGMSGSGICLPRKAGR